jgi:TolB-like protein/Flp pilus assembly protein TadD
MSPEQVRGLAVDHRSDIFSFGAVLYEMLSNKRAFAGSSYADAMSAILKEEPPELSESGRIISPTLDHIVRHCLEKDRDDRFQSAKDIAFALSEASAPTTMTRGVLAVAAPGGRRPMLVAAAIVVVVVSAGVGVLLMRRAPLGSGPAGGAKRMAVLPFENLGAPEDDYFADGMADEIRGRLTSLPGVQVIARASSTPYKKTTKTPSQIAKELGVGYLLTATVRWERAGGTSRVLVSPELIDVSGSGAPTSKWQQPFDAPLTDVFRVQADIAERVAQALDVALGSGEQKGRGQGPTKNLAAYDAFLRGEEASDGMAAFDPPTQRRALAFYEQAVAFDPEFAQAWAQVARARAYLYYSSVPAPDLAKRAREASERAVALAPKRAESYLAVGDQERLVAKDNGRALAQYERAGSLAPGNAQVLTATASAEQSLGRWEAAVEHFREAERLDPRSVQAHLFLGGAFLCLRRYPEALSTIDRGLAMAPANLGLIGLKVQIFLAQGDLTAARAVLKAATTDSNSAALVAYIANFGDLVWVLDDPQERLLLTLPPAAFDDDVGTWGICLAQACALRGDSLCLRSHAEEAARAYEKQLATAPQDAQRRMFHGLALAYLGRKDESVRDGELAVELNPVAKDAVSGPYFQHQLVRIYILVGELEKALDQLEPLLKTPYWLSPSWLRIDPNFDPLRSNPRFQRLASAK